MVTTDTKLGWIAFLQVSSPWDVIASYASLSFLILCFIIGYQGNLSMHCCVLYKFYVFKQRDVGELMFSLSRLNK